MNELEKKILAYVNIWHMLDRKDNVIIGVSGGADSVCLLYVLLELKKAIGFAVRVVHVHHGLRKYEADADEAYVKDTCERNNVPFTTYHYDVELIAKKRKQSTEEAGRILRREAFAETKIKYQGTKIAMAHHKNDNVETLFLNLARGTGLKGMGGILPVRNDIIRPLLCVEREEIETYMDTRGIAYCTDSTNESNIYTRNKIRNCVLPYLISEINNQVIEHVNQTMEQMREIQIYIKEQVSQCYLECVSDEEGGLTVCGRVLAEKPMVLQKMLLQKCLELVAGKEQDITSKHIGQMLELMDKQVGKQIYLPYHMVASRTYEGIRLTKGSEIVKKQEYDDIPLQIPEHIGTISMTNLVNLPNRVYCQILDRNVLDEIPQKTYTKWFDYDIINSGLWLRTRQTGDYITIDHEGRKQKLKSYFVNNKIPVNKRDRILLVAEGSHILWVTGYRISTAYQVNEHTKRILEIQIDGGMINGRNN